MAEEGKLHRTVLNQCLQALLRNLDFRMVAIFLEQMEVFDDLVLRDILEKETTTNKIMELIKRIQQRDQGTYAKFKQCLVQAGQPDLKDMLEKHETMIAVKLSDNKDRSTKADEQKGHVMISYSRMQKEKVLWIKTQLENNGFNIWIDDENMGRYVHDGMADGVERAHIVLLCMSKAYSTSENCKKEALYAGGKKKIIIPLKMEDFKPEGWLGILVADMIYYDFSENSCSKMKKLLQELASYYNKNLEEPETEPFHSTSTKNVYSNNDVYFAPTTIPYMNGRCLQVPDEVAPDAGAIAAPPIEERHGDISIPKEEAQAVEEQNAEQSMDEDKDEEPIMHGLCCC